MFDDDGFFALHAIAVGVCPGLQSLMQRRMIVAADATETVLLTNLVTEAVGVIEIVLSPLIAAAEGPLLAVEAGVPFIGPWLVAKTIEGENNAIVNCDRAGSYSGELRALRRDGLLFPRLLAEGLGEASRHRPKRSATAHYSDRHCCTGLYLRIACYRA